MAIPQHEQTIFCQLNDEDVCETPNHVHTYNDAVPMTEQQIRTFVELNIDSMAQGRVSKGRVIYLIAERWVADQKMSKVVSAETEWLRND